MNKESRKEQILACAQSLFASQGYDATALSQIAAKCGCSSSLIIRHFGSKENLYQALLRKLEEKCSVPYVPEVPEGNPLEELEKLYVRFTRESSMIEDENEELRSALRSWRGKRPQVLAAKAHIQDVGMEIFLPLLQRAAAQGLIPPDYPCETKARLLWLLINGNCQISRNYPAFRPLSFPEARELVLEI